MLITLTTTALALLLQQGQAEVVSPQTSTVAQKETFDVVTIDVWQPKTKPKKRLTISDVQRKDFTLSLKASADAL